MSVLLEAITNRSNPVHSDVFGAQWIVSVGNRFRHSLLNELYSNQRLTTSMKCHEGQTRNGEV